MVKYKNIFGDDFQLNQCHVNTSLGLVGGMHPLHPLCPRLPIVQLSKHYYRRNKHEAGQSMCAAMNVFFH